MRTRTQNKVIGTTQEAGFHQAQQQRVHDELQFYDSTTVKVEQTTRGVRFHAKWQASEASSGIVIMQLIAYTQDAVHGDYLTCRPPNVDTDGSGDVKVAVEPQLQSSITTQTLPDGSVWTYTYEAATGSPPISPQKRTSTLTGGSTVLTEYITPAFVFDPKDGIPVQSCSGSEVYVDGIELTLMAITGRQWASA